MGFARLLTLSMNSMGWTGWRRKGHRAHAQSKRNDNG